MTSTTYSQQIEAIATDPKFIELAANMAKALGITAQQWNDTKAGLLLMFAAEVWKRDNK
jgi:hypothetical protein